jgi:hypothetical protein
METFTKNCAVCDEPFTAKRKNAKTCSQKCRNALSIIKKLTNTPDVITDEISLVTTPATPTLITTEKVPEIADKNSHVTTPVITRTPLTPPVSITEKAPVSTDEISHVTTPVVTDKKQLVSADNISQVTTPVITDKKQLVSTDNISQVTTPVITDKKPPVSTDNISHVTPPVSTDKKPPIISPKTPIKTSKAAVITDEPKPILKNTGHLITQHVTTEQEKDRVYYGSLRKIVRGNRI